MKKKGFTLIELIVSVALISIVMVLMFNLLADLRNEDTESVYNASYKITSATINRKIQNILFEESLTNISNCSTTSYNCLLFTFADGDVMQMSIEKNDTIIFLVKRNTDNLLQVYEKRVMPGTNDDTKTYGTVGTITVKTLNVTKTTTYNLPYNALILINFDIIDVTGKSYPIEISYPYDRSSITILSGDIPIVLDPKEPPH